MSEGHPGRVPPRRKWAIQVVFRSGAVAFLRHGGVVGEGAIVQFRSRRDADVNLDFVQQGLDAGTTVSVVRYAKSYE